MRLSLLSAEPEGVFKLANEGDITMADFSASRRHPLEALVGSDWPKSRLLLDLGKTGFVDSFAVGWLISCHKECKRSGGMLVLHSIPPRVDQVLSLLKIGRIIPLATGEDAARALLAGAAA